jgi:tripartite-type tricarboxylate transporter receptor subunit TctC
MHGQQFLLDFKPGAGTLIGMQAVARAAPDGYTMLFVTASYPLTPVLLAGVSDFNPIKSLSPVSLMSKRSAMLLVHPSLPVKNMKEYVEYASANPDKINFGLAGINGTHHLTAVWLNSLTNTKTTFVGYKGSGPLVPDILKGRVHITLMSVSTGLPHIKSGKLRSLGIASMERSPLVPDMPTIAEQGLPEFEYGTWLGLLAPAETPSPLINKISSDWGKVAKSPDVVARLAKDAVTAVGSTPEVLARLIDSEEKRWKNLIQKTGFKFEKE